MTAEPEDSVDRTDALPARRRRFFWPALISLVFDAIPAGLGWWAWPLTGWLRGSVFVLCLMGGTVWTLGVLIAFFGHGRVLTTTELDDAEA